MLTVLMGGGVDCIGGERGLTVLMGGGVDCIDGERGG